MCWQKAQDSWFREKGLCYGPVGCVNLMLAWFRPSLRVPQNDAEQPRWVLCSCGFGSQLRSPTLRKLLCFIKGQIANLSNLSQIEISALLYLTKNKCAVYSKGVYYHYILRCLPYDILEKVAWNHSFQCLSSEGVQKCKRHMGNCLQTSTQNKCGLFSFKTYRKIGKEK